MNSPNKHVSCYRQSFLKPKSLGTYKHDRTSTLYACYQMQLYKVASGFREGQFACGLKRRALVFVFSLQRE